MNKDLDRFLNIRKDLVNEPINFREIEDIKIPKHELIKLEKIYKDNGNEANFKILSGNEIFN